MSKGNYISFCSKRAFNILDETLKQEILTKLHKNYYITIKDKNFYILNSKNIKYIEKNPHILSVKSIGSLYYLFLTIIDGRKYCLFIDKKIKEGHKFPRIISVIYRFDDAVFQDTVFDGELLRDEDDNWLYLINNLVLYKGELYKNKNIVQKLGKVYQILTDEYKKDDYIEICQLYVKRLFGYHEWDYIINTYIPNLKYKTRGLYFEGIRNLNNHLYLFQRNQTFNKISSSSDGSISITKNTYSNNSNTNNKNSNTYSNNSNTYSNNNKNSNTYSNTYSNNSNKNKSRNTNYIKVDEEELQRRTYMTFIMRKTDTSDIYNLYCSNNDDLKKYGIALIDGLKTSKKMRKLFQNDKDNLQMKCKYDNKKEKWIPIDLSDDKIDDYNVICKYIEVN